MDGLAGRIARRSWNALADALHAVGQDVAELTFRGPRARNATMSALAVASAVAIACAMALPDVWWAGISGFVCCQATRPASLQKGVLRIIGTIAGCALAIVVTGWLAYDELACCIAIFAAGTIGTLGLTVSRHAYAWLLFGLTFGLVVLLSLGDPSQAFSVGTTRTIEVVIGTITAMVMAALLAPPEAHGVDGHPPEPAAPGWTDLLGARWPALLHAVRAGVAIAILPLVWSWFDLPDVSSMATTMASVMAIPVLADHPLDDEARIIGRAMHRLLGCLLGGGMGVLLLGIQLTEFLPWLVALTAGIWVCAMVQTSTRGMTYVGMQAGLAFLMTLVQGEGPPTSMMPAVNRVTGITLGLLALCLVSILLLPAPQPDRQPA